MYTVFSIINQQPPDYVYKGIELAEKISENLLKA